MNVAGLLAQPARLRVFAAIALGARTREDIQQVAGISAAEVQEALRRLQRGGLTTLGPDGIEVDQEALRAGARAFPKPEPESFGIGDAAAEAILRTFVQGDRLIGFPSQWEKKIVVLSYLAARHFEPGRRYPEDTVNEVLLAWCAEAPIDHVSVRRYLVDTGVLTRENSEYWLPVPERQ